MRKLIFALALLPASVAFGQQQTPSAIDRISNSLGQCVSSAEQKVDQIIDLQKQLAAAQARIKELEKPKE